MEFIKQIDETINNALNNFVRKPTLVRGVVQLLLILYAARLAPTLPKPVLQLFENAYFKLFIFSLILWTAQFSPSTSILIALGFMITVNYVNKQPLWEFLDNVDPTSAPVAPSKDIAIQSVTAVVQQQHADTPVVQAVAQKQDTIVVQPSIIATPNGPAVVNPTIVVAPAVVSTPQGEKVVVKPDVTVVDTTSAATPAATTVSTPAPAPVAPKETQSEPAPAAGAQGCYPMRHYDLSKVNPYEMGNEYQDFAN